MNNVRGVNSLPTAGNPPALYPATSEDMKRIFQAYDKIWQPAFDYSGALAAAGTTRHPRTIDANNEELNSLGKENDDVSETSSSSSSSDNLTIVDTVHSTNQCADEELPLFIKLNGETRKRTRKRIRSVFTKKQTEDMELVYQSKQYFSKTELTHMAESLNLPFLQTKLWFQNRRAKDSKERRNARLANNAVQHSASDSSNQSSKSGNAFDNATNASTSPDQSPSSESDSSDLSQLTKVHIEPLDFSENYSQVPTNTRDTDYLTPKDAGQFQPPSYPNYPSAYNSHNMPYHPHLMAGNEGYYPPQYDYNHANRMDQNHRYYGHETARYHQQQQQMMYHPQHYPPPAYYYPGHPNHNHAPEYSPDLLPRNTIGYVDNHSSYSNRQHLLPFPPSMQPPPPPPMGHFYPDNYIGHPPINSFPRMD